MIIELCWLHC